MMNSSKRGYLDRWGHSVCVAWGGKLQISWVQQAREPPAERDRTGPGPTEASSSPPPRTPRSQSLNGGKLLLGATLGDLTATVTSLSGNSPEVRHVELDQNQPRQRPQSVCHTASQFRSPNSISGTHTKQSRLPKERGAVRRSSSQQYGSPSEV